MTQLSSSKEPQTRPSRSCLNATAAGALNGALTGLFAGLVWGVIAEKQFVMRNVVKARQWISFPTSWQAGLPAGQFFESAFICCLSSTHD